MSQPELKLTGGKAVIALVVIVGFAGFRFFNAVSEFETAGHEELIRWLRAEYQRSYLADDPEPTEALAQQLLALEVMSLPEVSARGTPDDLIVQGRIAVDGAPPPFGDEVRYFRMEYRSMMGWTQRGEVLKWQYYLKLF
jgi:hypothetical protein